MNKAKLLEQLEKYYWSHDQHFVLETMEVMDDTWNNCDFTVYLKDSEIYLFDVTNYNVYKTYECSERRSFADEKYHPYPERLDLSIIGNKPLYMDRVFTLKTTKPITKKDILNCMDYFLHEVIDGGLFFNVKFDEEKPNEK